MLQRLQIILIAITVIAAVVLAGCGPQQSGKNRAKINTSRTKTGAPNQQKNGPDTGPMLTQSQNPAFNQTGLAKGAQKIELKELTVPQPTIVNSDQMQNQVNSIYNGTKAIQVQEIPNGQYQLVEVLNILLVSNTLEVAAHQFSFDENLNLSFGFVGRSQKGMPQSMGEFSRALVTGFNLSNEGGISIAGGLQYKSQELPNKTKVFLLADPGAVLNFDKLQMAPFNNGVYTLVESKNKNDGRYVNLNLDEKRLILTEETRANGSTVYRNRKLILTYKYTASAAAKPAEKTTETTPSASEPPKDPPSAAAINN